MISTQLASIYLAASMPADVINSGKTAVSDVTGLFWTIAGAIAAFIFLRWFVQVKTFMSAIAAIAMGALVVFGVQIPQNGTADKTLNETVQNWFA